MPLLAQDEGTTDYPKQDAFLQKHAKTKVAICDQDNPTLCDGLLVRGVDLKQGGKRLLEDQDKSTPCKQQFWAKTSDKTVGKILDPLDENEDLDKSINKNLSQTCACGDPNKDDLDIQEQRKIQLLKQKSPPDVDDIRLEGLCIKVKEKTGLSLKVEVMSNLKCGDQLGSGSFGSVIKCFHTDKKKKLVMKRELKKDTLDYKELENLVILANSKNIVKCYGVVNVDGHLGVLLEDAGSSLRSFWQDGGSSNPGYSNNITTLQKQGYNIGRLMECHVIGIMRGMSELHKKCLVHCDIKPENICVSWDPNDAYNPSCVRIIDLGTCYKEPVFNSGLTGMTPEYLSWEWVNRQFNFKKLEESPLTHKEDMWAVGLTICFIANGRHWMHIPQIFQEYKKNDNPLLKLCWINSLTNKSLPDVLLRCPQSKMLEKLLLHLLTMDVSQRWTADAALNFLESNNCVCSGKEDQLTTTMYGLNFKTPNIPIPHLDLINQAASYGDIDKKRENQDKQCDIDLRAKIDSSDTVSASDLLISTDSDSEQEASLSCLGHNFQLRPNVH